MPNPIGGSYQVPGDLGQRLVGTEKAVAQLQRLMTQPSKLPAASTGGPIGIVDVSSTAGSVVPALNGSGIDWAGVSYAAPVVRHGVGSWISSSGANLTVNEAGYYLPVLQIVVGWAAADAPNAVKVYMNGGLDIAHQDADMTAPVPDATTANKGVYRMISRGGSWLNSGDYFRAEADFVPYTTGAFTSFGGGARINWTITRLA